PATASELIWLTPSSDIQDQLGHPAILIMNESYPMMSGRLDLMVQAMPLGVDRLAMNSCRQRAAVGIDDDVEESLGGCAKEIGKISRVNPQAKISRVIKRYRPSHEQASRSIPATAAAEPVHRSQERGIRLSGNDHWV